MDECLILLAYAAKHPDEKQTYRSLDLATGIDFIRIHELVSDARDDPYHSMLARAACKWRYDYEIWPPRSRRIIDAVYRGYGEG